MNNVERIIRSFSMSNQLLLSDLKTIEKKYGLEKLVVVNDPQDEIESNFYLQFNSELRSEAMKMANHYQLFYCLEKSIREMITDLMEATYGIDWWDKQGIILDHIKQEVYKNMKKEADSALTPRSSEPIDYTTFGQLAEIMKSNWDVFGSVFSNIKAVERVLGNLNSLRNPIAHCSFLAEDEVMRLHLSLRDWFRLASIN